MKIGIIGSGNIGGTLTRRFRAAGYEVAVANSRGPQSLGDLARETGAHPATVEQVARDSDVVVVTIPMKEIRALPRGLFSGARPDLIVIDTNNYYPRHRDGRIGEIVSAVRSCRITSATVCRSHSPRGICDSARVSTHPSTREVVQPSQRVAMTTLSQYGVRLMRLR